MGTGGGHRVRACPGRLSGPWGGRSWGGAARPGAGHCLPVSRTNKTFVLHSECCFLSDLWPYYEALLRVWVFLIQFTFGGKLITIPPSLPGLSQNRRLVAECPSHSGLGIPQPGQPSLGSSKSPLSRNVTSQLQAGP